MMRDQSYISSVGRRAEETGRELVGMGLIPRVANRTTGEGVLDERTEKELKFVREARGSGVKVVLLPKGMNRRIRNASRWNPKCVLFFWFSLYWSLYEFLCLVLPGNHAWSGQQNLLSILILLSSLQHPSKHP